MPTSKTTVVNGHLAIIAVLVRSFAAFPVGEEPFAFIWRLQPQAWGAEIFALGLWIALPLVGMLLFVNLLLGVIARVAPQINIFAVGFPVTLAIGFAALILTLPYFGPLFERTLDQAFRFVLQLR